MKKIFLAVLGMLLISNTSFARGRGGSHSVRGYTTKRGTHVAPHHATNRNHTRSDNWSTKGNVNLYTGKRGTKKSD